MNATIRQKVVFDAPPSRVFAALLESKRHRAFTGARATISRRVGGRFSCYGGYVRGLNLEIVRDRRIVQSWRARDWKPGVHSVVTFALSRRPGGKTLLSFTHVGVPPSDLRAKNRGWRTHYWEPLRAYLEA